MGLDEEAKTIKDRIVGGTNDLIVIPVVGMAGLGKTTLIRLVFKDRDLQHEFLTRLWIYVSKTFNRKQIFLHILSNFTKQTKDFQGMSEQQLADKIREFLEGGKYMVVMDDVCVKEDWDSLKVMFPNNMKGSRVLVSTQNEQVALHVDSTKKPHHLKFLSNDESWELLKRKVFGKESCPPALEEFGKRVAIKCNGLPLALVVVAGVLHKDNTLAEWKRVAEDPFPVINQENQSYHRLASLSYEELPFYVKDCFLYLAAFPMGHEIATKKLIWLWIAEGFIPQSEERHTSDLECTAMKYLNDLVDRNLLMVVKRSADGQIKTCRLQNTLHEFCKFEAAKKNLFHEIDVTTMEANNIDYCRLCVHSSLLEFIESEKKLSGEHVRSFLSYSSEQIDIPREFLATIPKAFPLLRVCDTESLTFEILPRELYQLYHLRYLATTTDLGFIPKRLINLWNIQTLILNSSQSIVKVKADIWSMTKLRHVHSSSILQLSPPSKGSKDSSTSMDLQTLSTISPTSCTEDILDMTPNLQHLGIRGNLAKLLESKEGICLFDNLQKLEFLENLKLVHDASPGQAHKLWSVPRVEKFPRRLRKLTLSNTSFEWKYMYILGLLEDLEVLKLDEYAFRGEYWELKQKDVFKSLIYLRIGKTDLVSWTTSNNSFPVLRDLHIRHCINLEDVPLAFVDVESLKVLELYCTNKAAATSAREILKQKQNQEKEKGCRFELSIYPPLH